MAYQLLERPYKYAFSRNPVWYKFNITNPNSPGCAMEVELYCFGINQTIADAVKVGNSMVLTPNPDGSVYFYCEDFLDAFMEWELPALPTNTGLLTPSDPVVAVTKQIKQYFIKYRQITKANPSPDWASEEDKIRIVIKGGIAKEKFDRNNFFINYLPTQKPFLTWLPADHLVGTAEQRYLTYFHHNPAVVVLRLKARVVYLDGSESVKIVGFPPLSDSLLFHLPAGLQQLRLYDIEPDKKIWYYDITVEDVGGTKYANAYRLYADYTNYYNVFNFIYHNSLSGIDTVRVRGEVETDINLAVTEVEQATGGDFSGQLLPTENASINASKHEVYKSDAGYQNTRAMQDALQEILLSDGVYRVLGGRWLRVMNLQKTQPMGGSEDTVWSFPLQWRYTFENTQYTPFNKFFGAGSNEEPPGLIYGFCTRPSTYNRELSDDQPTEQTWDFTWSLVGDAVAYEFQYTKPDGTVVTIEVPNPLHTLVLTEEGDYTWRVRSKCGDNDYSAWGNGAPFTVDLTPAACTSPAFLNIILMSIAQANADIKFSWGVVPGVQGYQLEWREVGAPTWQQSAFGQAVTNTTKTLKRDTQYECRIRSICAGGVNFGPWVYGNSFIPSNLVGACNAPTGLGVTVVVVNGGSPYIAYAKFTWTNAGSVVSYQLEYRKVGDPVWTTFNGVQSGVERPLTPDAGHTWEWRLRSNCTGGGFSPYINGANFNN